MSEQIQTESKSKGTGGYIVIIILLILGIGGMAFWIAKQKSEISELENQKLVMEQEMQGMNNMFADYGIMIKDDLRSNLDEMLAKYDAIEATSQEQRDSIEAKRNQILSLKSELEQANSDKKSYARTIYKLRKETETLRSVMKSYLVTIDSLNMENKGLKTDLRQTSDQLTQVTDEKNQLADQADKYAQTIKTGSKLQAYGILSEGIKVRNSGSFKTTTRANYTDQFRACFTLSKNNIASAGSKTIYMQVISPSGKILYERSSNIIKMDSGSDVIYSDKKTIDYQNQSVDVCIFYDLKGEKAEKGNYTIKLFADGAQIGKDDFVLK